MIGLHRINPNIYRTSKEIEQNKIGYTIRELDMASTRVCILHCKNNDFINTFEQRLY